MPVSDRNAMASSIGEFFGLREVVGAEAAFSLFMNVVECSGESHDNDLSSDILSSVGSSIPAASSASAVALYRSGNPGKRFVGNKKFKVSCNILSKFSDRWNVRQRKDHDMIL